MRVRLGQSNKRCVPCPEEDDIGQDVELLGVALPPLPQRNLLL